MPVTMSLFPHDGTTRVVNVKVEDFDVYGGRAQNGKPPRLCDIGEEGWLGNEYRLIACGPNALVWHARDFDERVAKDVKFRAGVLALRGKRIGCYCKPEKCHLDHVVAFIEANT